jgi:hypothetical protein
LIITAFYRRIGRNEPLKSGRFFGASLDWRGATEEGAKRTGIILALAARP